MIDGIVQIVSKLVEKLESKHVLLLIFLLVIGGGVWWYYDSKKEKFPIPDGQYEIVEKNDYSNKTVAGKIVAQLFDGVKKQLTLSRSIEIKDKQVISQTVQEDKRMDIETDQSGHYFIRLDVLGNQKRIELSYNTEEKILQFDFPNETLTYKKGN